MRIERLPGQLALELCEPGDELRVRGLAANGKPYELMGLVVKSSRVYCKLENKILFNLQAGGRRES